MNNLKIELFDELVVSEKDLGEIIETYIFPDGNYKTQIDIPNFNWWNKGKKEIKNAHNREIVLKNADKINFRNKNIIFLGYHNKNKNEFYFAVTTSQKPQFYNSFLYINVKNPNNMNINNKIKNIYVNLDQIYRFNPNERYCFIAYTAFSKIKGTPKEQKIIYSNVWQDKLLNNLRKDVLEELCSNTSEQIYKTELERRNSKVKDFQNLESELKK